ncbi:MAG: RNA polymerase sigma factor [Betaproteobacteria bacterium]|nr:RNA polymerase sigma factor [Betaproteobacteria bacterium]MDH3437347.1 RNA polymerase sigma factor [Betaproteobacteria bacterium]
MAELRALIEEQIPRLRRYARALTGDRSLADDLVQDTLERALTRFHLWRHGSDLRAWLFTIMHNIFVNQVRSRLRHQHEALESDAAVEAMRVSEPDWLELRDLDSALAQLPHEQRTVLLLVGLEQFTYEEAARVLQIPIGTVMSRLSRGRERLRAVLAGDTSVSPLKVVK